MKFEWEIRNANINDIDKLKEIESSCFDENIRENFDFVLNSPSHLYNVLFSKVDDSIVAYAGISISYEQGDILTVAVKSDYRKQGFAKGLLKSLFIEAKERGVQELFLEVEEDNTPAINLYKGLGFEYLTIRENYYGNKNAIIMVKKL